MSLHNLIYVSKRGSWYPALTSAVVLAEGQELIGARKDVG